MTFVYLLGGPDLITPNDPAPKYQPITPEMREATRKCEMYSRQAVLMGQEDINTKEDADAFLERTERELMAWATVHGVAKSQTGLRDFTFTFTH